MDRKQGVVLKTLQDIESPFEFGGEITPFLEELFGFLTDLAPLLAKMSSSLETTVTSMPAASDNIESANAMAENATTAIMDNLDGITQGLDRLLTLHTQGETYDTLQGLADQVNEIQVALQFQDITSQHLAQATQIVEAIQVRIKKMFGALQAIGEENQMVKTILDAYTSDTGEEGAIEAADTIRRGEGISQADIDALFGS